MITATMIHREGKLALVVSGHAGFAPAGQDIVCAGVSAIVNSLANGCSYEDHEAECVTQEDSTVVRAADTPMMRVVFRTAWLGLASIQEIYPQRIRLLADSQVLEYVFSGESREHK